MTDNQGEQGQRNSGFPRDIRKKDRIRREFLSAVEILDHAHMLLLGGAETTKTVRDTARETEEKGVPSPEISRMLRVWLREFLPGKARNLDKALDEKYKDPKRSRAGRTRGAKIALVTQAPVLATKVLEYPAANSEGPGRRPEEIIVAAGSGEGPLALGFIGLYGSYGGGGSVTSRASGSANEIDATTSGYVSLSGDGVVCGAYPATSKVANLQTDSGVPFIAISGTVVISGPTQVSTSTYFTPIIQLPINTSNQENNKDIWKPFAIALQEIKRRSMYPTPEPNSYFGINLPVRNVFPTSETLLDQVVKGIEDFFRPELPRPTKQSEAVGYFRF